MLSALSKSFTYPSQVAAAVREEDERHSRNRFAVCVDDASEESRKKDIVMRCGDVDEYGYGYCKHG
jgi:hypothetical protein